MKISRQKAADVPDTNVGDTISRQVAIDRIVAIQPTNPAKSEYTHGIDTGLAMAMVAIKEQPSVQPERTKGKWKVTSVYIKCSECGESFMLIPQNYCPNCGADMRGEQ